MGGLMSSALRAAAVLALASAAGACRFHFDPLAGGEAGRDAVAAGHIDITVVGFGAVTAPGGIACADHCGYDVGDPIVLTATPGEAWQLDHYDVPCGTSSTCTVDPGTSLTVTFTPSPRTANLVFVASTYPAPTIGVSGFDSACQTAATAAGHSGNFVAFVSTSTMNAVDRLAGKRGWVRFDGLPVFDQLSDIGQPSLPRAVLLTEGGAPRPGGIAMTGSNPDGTNSGQNCTDWTSSSGSFNGGYTGFAGPDATGGAGAPCTSGYGLYCFQVDRTTAVTLRPPPFPVGRYVFVASKPFAMTGIAAADAQCQADASAAGLAGSYAALLATTTQTAADHVGGVAGIWRRPDGLVVARAGLDQPNLDAAPKLDATGTLVPGAVLVFGAMDVNTLGTATTTCSDWTTTGTSQELMIRVEEVVTLHQAVLSSDTCSGGYRALCVQLP
jgi:hypothetical protein